MLRIAVIKEKVTAKNYLKIFLNQLFLDKKLAKVKEA